MLILSSVAKADYVTELELLLQDSNNDYGNNLEEESDGKLLRATVYFSPVTTENVPIAEAGFLSRQSSLGIDYIDLDTDYKYAGFFSDSNGSESENGKLLSGRFVLTGSELILGVDIGQVEVKYDNNGFLYDSDIDIIDLSIGWYLTDMSALTFGIGRTIDETEYQGIFSGFDFRIEEETTSILVDYKHVFSLYGGSYIGINGGIVLSETTDDSSDSYLAIQESVAVDWYPNERFSIGFDMEYINYDSDDFNYDYYEDVTELSYSLNTRYYFNEKIGLSASLGKNRTSDNDGTIFDGNSVSLGLHINI
jgi:hypothetical protein